MICSDGFILTGRWSMPTNMFLVFVCSVAATKVCDFIALLMHPEFATWSKPKKLLAVIFHPLMPAFIHVEEVFHTYRVAQKKMLAKFSEDRSVWGDT